jgi:NADH dehydrogenase
MEKDGLRVVVVGAGFGGIMAARNLAGADVRVTVIDRANHHLFQPLLYQVATAALSPAHIAAPIRDVLHSQRNAEVFLAEVSGVDIAGKRVLLVDHDPVPYDYLVLAPGSKYNYFGHEDWEKNAPSLKTLSDAVAIRQDILLAFEAAEMEPDPERRRALLTFVLVGGGPTGVELAGSLAELAHRAMHQDFRHIRPEEARILILEASPKILSMFPEKLANAAEKALERLGVEVRTSAKVDDVEPGYVVAGGERIPCSTVLWTAGVVAAPAGRWLGIETDKGGRVKVEPDLSVPGHADIFVIGDAARVEHDGKPLPGVAPAAMQEGRYVARLIRARIAGRSVEPFRYRDKGNLATVGRSFAILDLGKLKLSGFVAWVLWLWIHIWYLIGFRNKIGVFFQWAYAYFTWQRAARLITGPVPAPGASSRGDKETRKQGDRTAA